MNDETAPITHQRLKESMSIIDGKAVVGYGWHKQGMRGFALGHNPPTKENLHHSQNIDDYLVIPLVAGIEWMTDGERQTLVEELDWAVENALEVKVRDSCRKAAAILGFRSTESAAEPEWPAFNRIPKARMITHGENRGQWEIVRMPKAGVVERYATQGWTTKPQGIRYATQEAADELLEPLIQHELSNL